MSPENHVHEFNIEVTGNKIKVTEDPRGADIPELEVKLGPVRKETIDLFIKMLREDRFKDIDEYKVLGENLYSVLFDNEIGEAINTAYYEDKTTPYILIKLSFIGNQYLTSLPWEYLYRPKIEGRLGSGFLAKQSKLILMRNLQLGIKPPVIEVDELPLKILFVAPSPREEARVEHVQILEVFEVFKEEHGDDFIVYELTEPDPYDEEPVVTFKKFMAWVESIDPHIIHFVGHGKYDIEHGGRIAFMGLDYYPDWISDNRFADILAEGPSLRLVFLQACESGLPNPYQAFSGVAMELAHRNIPAVIAMQYKIKQHVASQFAQEFYKALIEKNKIEYAVQQGRREIAGELEGSYSFGLPVLYMRESGALMKSVPVDQGTTDTKQATTRVQLIPSTGTGETESEILCPWDGKTLNSPSAKFCGECGRDLECPKCGQKILKKTKFCTNCRHQLVEEVETISTEKADKAPT